MISVIVPVYRSEKYLSRCISSLIHQSFLEIEIILVLDGFEGNEKCKEICFRYANADERVHVYQKENEGVDKTRFYGLDRAIGEFITFVDADDWLEKDALAIMMNRMTESDYDYVEIKSRRRVGPVIKNNNISVMGRIEVPALFDNYYLSFFGINILPVNIWGKLYRKDVLYRANLRPSGFSMGEDLVFNMSLFPFLRKVFIEDYYGYNYRYGGMTSRYNPFLFKDSKQQYLLKCKYINEYQYYKAINPLRIEMINILKSDVIQRLSVSHEKDLEIIRIVEKEISTPFWNEVVDVNNYSDKPFLDALIKKDARRIFDICCSIARKNRIRRYTINILFRIISFFN